MERYKEVFREELVAVWEKSVVATHHFLKPEDFQHIKSLVKDLDFNAFEVYCHFNEENELIGFVGTLNKKVEMLFVAPEHMGKGIGKQMINFAMTTLKATEVDVNEDNTQAVQFYQKLGFQTYQRNPLDGQGHPYPILQMRL